MSTMIRIVGDCKHPWYAIPDELPDDVKVKPLKCPFCECLGAPISELVGEMKVQRARELKAGFKEERTRKKNRGKRDAKDQD